MAEMLGCKIIFLRTMNKFEISLLRTNYKKGSLILINFYYFLPR